MDEVTSSGEDKVWRKRGEVQVILGTYGVYIGRLHRTYISPIDASSTPILAMLASVGASTIATLM